jgi:uncharacterized protein
MSRCSLLWRWLLVSGIAAIGIFLSTTIIVNDDALDMLPGKAVSGDVRLLGQLGLVNRVIISLTLQHPTVIVSREEQAGLKKSAASIASVMEESGLFSNIMYKLPENTALQIFSSLQTSLPLLLNSEDLAALSEQISSPAIEEALHADFVQLNSPAGIAMKKQIQQDPLGISKFLFKKLHSLQAPFSMNMSDGFFLSKDGRSCLIIAESRLDLTKSNAALKVKEKLDAAFKTGLVPGVQAQLIGSLPHTLANALSIKRDLQILPPVAAVLLLILLLVTLKSPRALFIFAIPMAAIPTAIGLFAIFIGHINGIALCFGVVLLGIADDYGIPIFLALSRDPEKREQILGNLKKPLGLGYLTTAAVFFVLLFSEVPVQRQMAMLALTGITLALLFAWLIVPTIVPTTGKKTKRISISNRIPLPPPLLRNISILVWISLLVAGLLAWPNLHYNGDLRALDVPDRTVISAEQSFRDTWGQRGEQAFVVASGKTLDEALEKNSLIFKTLQENNAASFQSIAPILPSVAEQKKHLAAWKEFWKAARPDFDARFQQMAEQSGFAKDGFAPFFQWLDREPGFLVPDSILPGPLKSLTDTLIHPPGERHGDGTTSKKFLIMTTVTLEKNLLAALMSLEQQNKEITLLANQKWQGQVENLLRRDISILSLAATIITIVITMISFPHPKAIAAILAPVASALCAMSVYSFLTTGELNMMHLLMGILVIGISVDYGIFIVCSRLAKVSTISRSTVSICAASTLFGFGVLSFATHPALHSLGMTVLVGIGAAWPTALLVSPVILGKALLPAAGGES